MGMNVGQVMSRPVLATTERASVRDIANQLVRAGISGMPVADTPFLLRRASATEPTITIAFPSSSRLKTNLELVQLRVWLKTINI